MKSKKCVWIAVLALTLVLLAAASSWAGEPCQPVEKKPVKVEGWISQKFKKERKQIFKDFGALGHTRVRLKVFPMGDTAKVVAIGRCVPAYLARHILKLTLAYTSGVESLVNQAFISGHWVGIGTTMFDEPSQQKVDPAQVEALLNPDLSTEEFHALYQKFSVQDETVPYFGLDRPNAKQVQ